MTKSKIAVLLTDYSPEYAPKFGNFAEQSRQLLQDVGCQLDFDVYDAIQSNFPSDKELNDIKAIWITGSTSDAFSNEKWILNLVNYIQHIYHNHDIPFIGICFGHQILSRAIGGKVARSAKGWELGTVEVKLSDNEEIRDLFEDRDTLKLIAVHQDVVVEAPSDWITIGSNNHTEHQGFFKKDKVLTFQGHPEFTNDFLQTITESLHEKDKIDTDIYDKSLKSLTNNHEGSETAKIILRFIK